jgi:glycosyltransferase involved in cell wall biosynthesis
MNVLVLSQGLAGAIPFYRLSQPLNHCKRLGLLDVDYLDSRVDKTPIENKMKWADVIVMQARTDWKAYALVKQIQQYFPEKMVVVEWDDNIFEISPYNEKYITLGTKEVKLTIDKKDDQLYEAYKQACKDQDLDLIELSDGKLEAYLWKDGIKGFNLDENIDRMQAAADTIYQADLATCTTKELAKKLKSHSGREDAIAILPNLIDFDLWKPQKPNDTGKLRILWAGGSSHYRDFSQAESALLQLQEEYDFTLVIAGQLFRGKTNKIKDLEVIPWHGDIRTYPMHMRDVKADIGLIPLEGSEFDKGKSALKWLEYSALGIPSVASDVTPYKQVIKHGKTGLLAKNTHDSWYNNLKELIDSKELRQTLADKAVKRVKDKYSTDRSIEWYNAYKTMLDIKKRDALKAKLA